MLTWTIVGATLIGAPALKDGRKPAEPPAGDWAVQRLEYNGRVIIENPDGYTGLRITPNSIGLLPAGSSERVAFFEAARGPCEVDYNPGDPKKVRKGIWKVDVDTLTICEAPLGADRPTEFAAPAGSKRGLWVLKRVPKN
ncbi:MAG TPA: hypothetical protein VKD90_16330 [Gemmataceae bacterium]|nr:hypothetical protein [Gemmataceae bacterium]